MKFVDGQRNRTGEGSGARQPGPDRYRRVDGKIDSFDREASARKRPQNGCGVGGPPCGDVAEGPGVRLGGLPTVHADDPVAAQCDGNQCSLLESDR